MEELDINREGQAGVYLNDEGMSVRVFLTREFIFDKIFHERLGWIHSMLLERGYKIFNADGVEIKSSRFIERTNTDDDYDNISRKRAKEATKEYSEIMKSIKSRGKSSKSKTKEKSPKKDYETVKLKPIPKDKIKKVRAKIKKILQSEKKKAK